MATTCTRLAGNARQSAAQRLDGPYLPTHPWFIGDPEKGLAEKFSSRRQHLLHSKEFSLRVFMESDFRRSQINKGFSKHSRKFDDAPLVGMCSTPKLWIRSVVAACVNQQAQHT